MFGKLNLLNELIGPAIKSIPTLKYAPYVENVTIVIDSSDFENMHYLTNVIVIVGDGIDCGTNK